MIGLDLDLGYLNSYYHIGTTQLEQYRNMSLVEIMKAEAVKGNSRAAQFLMHITANPDELAKILQLVNPQNRYLILRNMNKNDLMDVMQFLEPKELVLGLSIFTQEALVGLMMFLEPESLATVVLEKMDAEKFLAVIPEKFLDEFIDSDKITTKMFLEALKDVDQSELQKMMESFSGQSCYDEKDDIISSLSNLSDDNFMRAMHQFEPKGKQQLILGLLKNKPELFEEFSPEAMTHPFKTMEKEEILKSLLVLNTEDMLPMVEDLPPEAMSLIAAQINPQVFARLLCSKFKDVIADCGINFN